MMQLMSTESGRNLPLPNPLVKLICEQETALNQQGFILRGKGRLVFFLINTHTVFQLYMRQQVKEIACPDGENMRRLLSRNSKFKDSLVPKKGRQVVHL